MSSSITVERLYEDINESRYIMRMRVAVKRVGSPIDKSGQSATSFPARKATAKPYFIKTS